MASVIAAWTEEELLALEHPGAKCEMIGGELIMSPAGYDHENICAALLTAMRQHAMAHKLGSVCGSSFGCWMASGNLLSPDVSFIRRDRLPRTKEESERFFRGAPDLVVEILSPWDRTSRLQEKMEDYFASGARLAWVVHPDDKSVQVYHSPARPKLLTRRAALDGEDVLPGFRLPLAELFAASSAG